MVGIIVVFPSKDNAVSIRNLLVRYGTDVAGVCTTGAKALQYTDAVDEGVVVCGYKMKDMMYTELREYLPEDFEMLLIASPKKWAGEKTEGVVCLPMPFKAYDLINTMEMLLKAMELRRRKRKMVRKMERKNRDPKQREVIAKAKLLLMDRNHMLEEEAHRYLQKCSMESGTNMAETAEMVLSVMAE